jgi:protein-S-isoprenylcysteine O-methyltransferase Ste14
MISIIVLSISMLLILMVFAIVARAIIKKHRIIGRPPIPVIFFILAKMLVLVNLVFLLLKGLNVDIYALFNPVIYTDLIGLAFLITGTTIVFLSTFRLNKDLIFGLSSSPDHKLQTKGIYSLSRHPFYLGFLCILFSSCLFIPNPVNIVAFLGAWTIHHFIMIEEEQFLSSQYGEEYRQYTKKVRRYITLY